MRLHYVPAKREASGRYFEDGAADIPAVNSTLAAALSKICRSVPRLAPPFITAVKWLITHMLPKLTC